MKIKKRLIAFCFLSAVSCKNDRLDKDRTAGSGNEQKIEISTKAIENFKFDDYSLSQDAEDIVSKWNQYQELSTQISFLRRADLTFFTSEKDTLKVFLDSMRMNIPEAINTNPINSRLSVLETKMLKLNNDLALGNYSVDNKLKSIKELLVANSDLIYLINKKLEYDENNVSRPLENIEE